MRRPFNWAIPAFLAIPITIAVLATLQVLSAASPEPAAIVDRCGSCHQMEDHVASWQASAHKDVACTSCHADKGIWGWLHAYWSEQKMEDAAVSMLELDPGQIDVEVPNQRCVACHASQMPWVMVDLKPPQLTSDLKLAGDLNREDLAHLPALAAHDLHLTLDEPVACYACHVDVSHGPVDRAGKQAFNHGVCQSCHTEQQIILTVSKPVSCAACHLDLELVLPDGHRAAGWRDRHGGEALKADAACAACHLGSGLGDGFGPESEAVCLSVPGCGEVPSPHGFSYHGSGSLDENSCIACHREPMPHPDNWLAGHDDRFRQDPEVCASCHGTGGQGFELTFAGNPKAILGQPACTSCHQVEIPHPAGWLGRHGSQAIARPEACAQCHTPANRAAPAGAAYTREDFCTGCHAGVAMPHPAGASWRGQHGALARQNPASCTACHSPANPAQPQAAHADRQFCQSCHQTQMPHPPAWLGQHGARFAQNPQLCASCHGTAGGDFSMKYTGNPGRLPTAVQFCASCHGGQAMPHPATWLKDHGAAARAPAAACAACHSPANPARPQAAHAAPQFCADCHGTPMPHPSAWPVTHGQAARQAGASCSTCHSSANPAGAAPHTVPNYCLNCHLGQYRHPAGWVAEHKTAVARAGGASEAGCATCHSQEPQGVNSCAACHTGGIGAPFHPDRYWFIKHGAAVNEQGREACLSCHAYVEPSCLQCHRRIP